MDKDDIEHRETHLSTAEQSAVQRRIKDTSLDAVAGEFKVAHQTLRAVAWGAPGRRGTIHMIRAALKNGNGR